MDVDKSLVRAACSFLGISGSGPKPKVYTKILNRNKKMELLNAKSLASEARAQETRRAVGQRVAPLTFATQGQGIQKQSQQEQYVG